LKNTFGVPPQQSYMIGYGNRDIEIDSEKNLKIRLDIWDLTGYDRESYSTKADLRGSRGVILTYDITNRKSFDRLPKLIEVVRDLAEPDTIMILVGNKSDLEEYREVDFEEGSKFA
jgi:GTPase SAR1 family protein